jgi:hypothetical protein
MKPRDPRATAPSAPLAPGRRHRPHDQHRPQNHVQRLLRNTVAPIVTTILLLAVFACLPTSRAYTSPLSAVPGYWSFAVRSDAVTMVVFPGWWPTLGSPTDEYAFEVQKSRHRYVLLSSSASDPTHPTFERTIGLTSFSTTYVRAAPLPTLRPSHPVPKTFSEMFASPSIPGMARSCTTECR